MKFQLPPLILLLLTVPVSTRSIKQTLAHADVDLTSAGKALQHVARAPPLKADPSPAHTSSSARPTKVEVGTKDAPVDGLDGKPHAGPFVESPLTESNKKRPALEVPDAKPTAEDGVMNDPNRRPPKKGTTGTEGGVSEKERDRKLLESETGQKPQKIPDPPKEAPRAPPSERAKEVSLDDSKNLKESLKQGNSDNERPKGAPGIEKPSDLPQKPKDKLPNDASSEHGSEAILDRSTPVTSSDTTTSVDREGQHDIIKWDSLAGSFSSIAATEIGDKTFIVAALMAMRYPRFQVFTAAFSALFIMTILSGLTGHAVGALISKKWAAVVAALLFLVFGIKSLREGMAMSPDQGVSEEMREVEAELEEKEVDIARQAKGGHNTLAINPYILEAGRRSPARRSRSRSRIPPRQRSPSSPSRSPPRRSIKSALGGIKNLLSLLLSPAWVETFSMTFVGELGDRSQIATVAMAAGQEYYWIMIGATAGHFVCTAVAVLGGSVLAGRVSMRKVTLVGGGIFLGFGVFTLLEASRYFY